MIKLYTFILALVITISSCELLENVDTGELTKEEVVEGLKTALKVGTDSSTTILSQPNAYYNSLLLRIPLPPDVEKVRNTINNTSALDQIFNNDIINLDSKFEDLVLSLNKAAGNAAREASPIFKTAITDLTIDQAWDILNGKNPSSTTKSMQETFDSTAATNYFINKTSTALTDLYGPKINNVLDKPLGSNTSTLELWSDIVTKYNDGLDIINSNFITSGLDEQYNLPSSLNADLGAFCTEKALDGLFLKVGETEKNIRQDPWEWAMTAVGDILEKVFGEN